MSKLGIQENDAEIFPAKTRSEWYLNCVKRGPININCGSNHELEAHGERWLGDRLFCFTGSSVDNQEDHPPFASLIAKSPVFGTQRYGFASGTGYRFPLPNGDYEVTLIFVEDIHREPGKRVFDVSIEDDMVLEQFDTFAVAGYAEAFE